MNSNTKIWTQDCLTPKASVPEGRPTDSSIEIFKAALTLATLWLHYNSVLRFPGDSTCLFTIKLKWILSSLTLSSFVLSLYTLFSLSVEWELSSLRIQRRNYKWRKQGEMEDWGLVPVRRLKGWSLEKKSCSKQQLVSFPGERRKWEMTSDGSSSRIFSSGGLRGWWPGLGTGDWDEMKELSP